MSNELAGDLRRGIDRRELELHFQPKVRAADLRVVGCEALVRWRHPEWGLLGPSAFLGVAEAEQMIGEITSEVIRMSMLASAHWRRNGWEGGLSVNLSAVDLNDSGLPDRIRTLADDADADLDAVTFEISEDFVLAGGCDPAPVIAELASVAGALSLDDFGAGATSLAHLCDLEIDEIKLDRSLVSRVESSAKSRIVIDSIIEMAHRIGLTVVAEGIESRRCAEFLRTTGCDELQGFFFGRPVPDPEFTVFGGEPALAA
ncbi:MAG TPA: EAL domain-containing protein [Solirubrobacterales bacterium]|nr:EAL domain-containing protein [Solirubrobacterales bacterium]